MCTLREPLVIINSLSINLPNRDLSFVRSLYKKLSYKREDFFQQKEVQKKEKAAPKQHIQIVGLKSEPQISPQDKLLLEFSDVDQSYVDMQRFYKVYLESFKGFTLKRVEEKIVLGFGWKNLVFARGKYHGGMMCNNEVSFTFLGVLFHAFPFWKSFKLYSNVYIQDAYDISISGPLGTKPIARKLKAIQIPQLEPL